MALQLKKTDSVTKEALDRFTAGWQGEEIIPSTLQKYTGDMAEFAQLVETMEKDPPRLLVNSTLWFLTEGEEILGAIELRHFLNTGLARYGGHVGYGVMPAHRGHGYGRQMLKMINNEAAKLGISSLLICCLEENIASAKTILNAGGTFGDEVSVIRGGVTKTGQSYWLDIK